MRTRILPVLSVVLLCIGGLSAQAPKLKPKQRYWTVDISAGAANYLGDLAPKNGPMSFDVGQTGITAGASLSRRYTSRWSARIGFSWFRIRGSDFASADPNTEDGLKRYLRNLHFRNDLFEISAVGVFDLIPHTGYLSQRPKWAPYLFGGVGVIFHSPQAVVPIDIYKYELQGDLGPVLQGFEENIFPESGEWINLRPLETEGVNYSVADLVIPVGAGLRYAVSQRVNLNFEFGYRFTFTDYLDDVSSETYFDIPGGDPLRAAMAIRALERSDAITGEDRNLLNYSATNINNGYQPQNYQYSSGDTYFSPRGYTHEVENGGNGNIPRGNPEKKDHYFSASLGVGIVFGNLPSRPKLR